MQIVQGRPRLRDRLHQNNKHAGGSSAATGTALWNSYHGFCVHHQFPPTLSTQITTRMYFLAAQVCLKKFMF